MDQIRSEDENAQLQRRRDERASARRNNPELFLNAVDASRIAGPRDNGVDGNMSEANPQGHGGGNNGNAGIQDDRQNGRLRDGPHMSGGIIHDPPAAKSEKRYLSEINLLPPS
jgi:hypothetical protein